MASYNKNYIKIDDVAVFPTSGDIIPRYGEVKSNFRVLSETNISKMWESVLDSESFVKSCTTGDNGDIKLEFFIAGHYFSAVLKKAMLDEFSVNNNTTIYATILLGNAPTNGYTDKKTSAEHYKYLVVGLNHDDENQVDYFTGVQFTRTIELCPEGDQNINGRVIVPSSYYKNNGGTPPQYTYYVTPCSLEVLNYIGGSGVVPRDSLKKFNSMSLGLDEIDGGVVE